MATIKIYDGRLTASFCPASATQTKTFHWNPLYSGGECDVDGFDGPTVVDLETLEIDNDPPALIDHNPDWVCGRLANIRIETDADGVLMLNCDAVVGGNEFGQWVIDYSKRGPVNLKPSIGVYFRTRWYNIDRYPMGETVRVNGKEFTGPVEVIRHGHLTEGSFVTLAGDPNAKSLQARFRTLKAKGNIMTFEEFLTSREMTQEMFDALPPEEQEALKNEFNAALDDDPPDETPPAPDALPGSDPALDVDPSPGTETAAGEAIKEAVEEAVAEQIAEMSPDEAATTYLEIVDETTKEMTATCDDPAIEDEEKLKACAKRIATKKIKARLFRAKIRQQEQRRGGSALAESRRQNGIKALCASYGRRGGEIAGKAIAGGWSYGQTERTLKAGLSRSLRNQSRIPLVPGRDADGRPNRQNILTAAFAMTCGLKPDYVKKHFAYDDATMNAALAKDNRRVSFKRLVHESVNSFRAGSCGIDTPMIDALPMMRQYCRNQKQQELLNPRFRASMGFSTISATDILRAIIEAYLLDQPEKDQPVYRTITKEVSFVDFNSVDAYLPTLVGKLSKISETGQIEHVGYTTTKLTQQTEPLGATFAIPQMVIINDQLSAFVALLEQFRTLPDDCIEHDTAELFWKMVDGDVNYQVDSAAFFSTTRGNLVTGAGSALGETGLANAEKALDSFKDANGAPIASAGAFLLTGTQLSAQARRLYTSENLNVADTVGERNVYFNAYTPVKWKYLNPAFARALKDNGSTASDFQTYGSSMWFLFRDPARRPLMTVNKLAGYESPQVKEYDSDPSVWGTTYQLIYPYKVSPMWPDAAVAMRGQ